MQNILKLTFLTMKNFRDSIHSLKLYHCNNCWLGELYISKALFSIVTIPIIPAVHVQVCDQVIYLIPLNCKLRYVLIDSDRIAFMFNGAPFPALNINPIDTNICMRHLQHNI